MNVTIGGIARTVEITSFDKLGDVKVCMLTTTADGSVGFQQLNQEVVDTIYASFPVDTASGDIASFEDGADNVPVREMKINVEPYQNLNGYDYPWVGGAGVNKLPYNSSGTGTITRSGITVAVNNGVFTISGTATAGDGINYPLVQSVDLSPSTNKIVFLNSVADGTITVAFKRGNTTVHFWTMTPVNRVATGWTDSGNEVIDTIAIQWTSSLSISGSIKVSPMLIALTETTPTSYIPYENICPIYPNNGKNLLDTESFVAGLVKSTGDIAQYGTSIVSKDNGIVKFTATLAWEGVASDFFPVYGGYPYCVSNADTVAYYIIGWYDGNKTFISREIRNASTGYISVTSPSGAKYARASFQVATAGTWEISKLQFEFGGTHTAYVPYESLGVTRTGKNLWSLASGGTATTDYIIPWTLLSVPKGTYTFSFKASIQNAIQPIFRDSTGANMWSQVIYPTALVNGYYKGTITFDRNVANVSIYANGTATLSEIQLEVGSSATQYEPYTAERYYSISDNPVYGGTLEVETGVLTVTKGYAVINGSSSESWGWHSGRNSPYVGVSGGIVTDAVTQYNIYVNSDKFKPVSWASTGSEDYCVGMYYGASFVLFKNTSIFTDLATAKTWFANNPTQVTYELATPQTYQLSPTQVKTLLGYNNIWTDSGTVEVQYLANIGLYIQKIIGATEDDMVANQNISANKYFFVGETLYYSTSAISAGQTIVVGTNCIKTNLADALNALNS